MPVLLVDSYDSFTYNLRDLIHAGTNAEIITIHNDSYNLNVPSEKKELNHLLDSIDAIIIGPGPGSPSLPSDIGIIPYVFNYCPNTPILGICLGFQILCLLNNCTTDYLKDPIHGQIHKIDIIDNSSLFRDFSESFESVRYHSIFVNNIEESKTIKPLAYYNSPDDGSRILMAVQHTTSPHFGVQYHPESICSSFGLELVKNFWDLAVKSSKSKPLSPTPSSATNNHLIKATPLIKEFINHDADFDYQFVKVDCETKNNLQLCDLLQSLDYDIMLLNSASAPGEWSIIGVPIKGESDVISHSTEANNTIKLSKWKNASSEQIINSNDLFEYVANFMEQKYYNPVVEHAILRNCPFIGGLIGYLSYEEGSFIEIENLQKRTETEIDDTKLCFIERFLAISPNNEVFVVSIKKDDSDFLNKISSFLSNNQTVIDSADISKELRENSKIVMPNKDQYFETFDKCQEYLHSGDSYELCLTYNTIVQIPNNLKPWDIYKSLVKKNPSPYSAYINFDSSLLLSTSPERFISWNKEKCQMRPIKGTLKKQPYIDYNKACELLKIPKELGENLMIVDLIRDNLLFLLDKIEVTKLMSVEEYETIYQLVSVIDGYFSNEFTGIDVLKNSLPPGSMTGAPKKRSVEILQNLELNQRRGLYSGVCGYWSINDNADWSVIIRSLFRYKDDLDSIDGFDTYRCGAGGALTVLSTDLGEWEEMLVKLHSVLQLFEP